MNDIELNGLEIKPYIHSQKNCRPSASGYVMEALDSSFIIDLSNFQNISKIAIITKRISGNGKVIINDLNFDVLSKDSNILEIGPTKTLTFLRNDLCIGKIIIANIKISINDVQLNINPSFIDQRIIAQNPENWRNLLMKCGEIRGIKLVNNKLLVSEGAFIQKSDLINYIETEPPNCFIKSDVIKFIYPCEITNISFSENTILVDKSNTIYKHFNEPVNTMINVLPSILANDNFTAKENMTKSDNIIYDSLENGINPSTLTKVDDVEAHQGKNNKGAIIKKDGTFCVPLSMLQPNMQYVVVVNIKKINGNGKFGIQITTTDNIPKGSVVTVATDRETELYLKLNTDSEPTPGNSYMLKFFRPEESSFGDLLLNRLMVISGIALANLVNPQNNKPAQIKVSKFNNKNETDPIRGLAKLYHRNLPHKKTNPIFNYSGEISLKSSSAINWFNKLSPLCSKIKVTDNAKILFSELTSLNSADIIFLEPFTEDISSEDMNILQCAKIIISSSSENVKLLTELFPNVSVKLLERTWPMIESTPIKHLPKDYCVMFHRNAEITHKVVSNYPNNYPPLVLIGAQHSYNENIIQLNEYISYDKILDVLINCKILIDFPEYNQYMSGLLSLAFDYGIPVVTSNNFGKDKYNCKFLISNKNDKINLPEVENIQKAIVELLEFKKLEVNSEHNKKLDELFSTIFN